jgi:hypothetical protein
MSISKISCSTSLFKISRGGSLRVTVPSRVATMLSKQIGAKLMSR